MSVCCQWSHEGEEYFLNPITNDSAWTFEDIVARSRPAQGHAQGSQTSRRSSARASASSSSSSSAAADKAAQRAVEAAGRAMGWAKFFDASTGTTYWRHSTRGETVWELPADVVVEVQKNNWEESWDEVRAANALQPPPCAAHPRLALRLLHP